MLTIQSLSEATFLELRALEAALKAFNKRPKTSKQLELSFGDKANLYTSKKLEIIVSRTIFLRKPRSSPTRRKREAQKCP